RSKRDWSSDLCSSDLLQATNQRLDGFCTSLLVIWGLLKLLKIMPFSLQRPIHHRVLKERFQKSLLFNRNSVPWSCVNLNVNTFYMGLLKNGMKAAKTYGRR